MGKELFETETVFRDWMHRLDRIVYERLGQSVIDEIYSPERDKSAIFDRTLLTHPAIFMVEYSLAQALIAYGINPDKVVGVSLGSFAAAAVAGFVHYEDILNVAIQQAMVIEDRCEAGGMVAVMADPSLYGDGFISSHSELVSVNFSDHFTISAKCHSLVMIERKLAMDDITFQRLPVSYAFHSRWIDSARDLFQDSIKSTRFRAGRLPLISCDQMTSLASLPDDFFWNVVRMPIRFRETIAKIEIDSSPCYIDVGPSGTLATFLKYTLPKDSNSLLYTVLTPYGREKSKLDNLVEASQTHGFPE